MRICEKCGEGDWAMYLQKDGSWLCFFCNYGLPKEDEEAKDYVGIRFNKLKKEKM